MVAKEREHGNGAGAQSASSTPAATAEQDVHAELAQLRAERVRANSSADRVRANSNALRALLRRLVYDSPIGPAVRDAIEAELARPHWQPDPAERVRRALQPIVNFSWVVPGQLAGCGRPDVPAAVLALADEGVRSLVSLTEDAPPAEWLAQAGIEGFHVSGVRDMGAPTAEQLAAAVDYIEAALAAGKPVAVHCQAGAGRTGTVLAAYFAAQGTPADEAIARVRALRRNSVESAEQENAVRAYAQSRGAVAQGRAERAP